MGGLRQFWCLFKRFTSCSLQFMSVRRLWNISYLVGEMATIIITVMKLRGWGALKPFIGIVHLSNLVYSLALIFLWVLVLGKFGLKLIQTQFEPNWSRVSSFQFGKFLPKPNGLVSGFGLLKFLKWFQIRFKPQTVCTYNFFFIATVNCFVVYLILIYIYITLISKCIYSFYI